jgi:excisionase family DNA binding protein
VTNTNVDKLYRVGVVAQMYEVSPATIYRAIKAGALEALKIGRSVRIPERALARFEIGCAEAARDIDIGGSANAAVVGPNSSL